MQKEFWRARLMDPDEPFFDQFSQPPQVLYKYIPAVRLDHARPDEKPCSFRVTPPNELNDINEINYKTLFVDDEKNRENINQEYALTLTGLFPTSPISVDDVERYRQKHPLGYGAELTCDQLCPRVVNQENAYAFMSSKGAAWEYEQEWRLITELAKKQQSGKTIAVITVPQESVSSIAITDRTSQDTVDIIVRRLNNPANDYRIWWIDKMQRGRDATTLAFTGQMKTRAQRSIQTA